MVLAQRLITVETAAVMLFPTAAVAVLVVHWVSAVLVLAELMVPTRVAAAAMVAALPVIREQADLVETVATITVVLDMASAAQRQPRQRQAPTVVVAAAQQPPYRAQAAQVVPVLSGMVPTAQVVVAAVNLALAQLETWVVCMAAAVAVEWRPLVAKVSL